MMEKAVFPPLQCPPLHLRRSRFTRVPCPLRLREPSSPAPPQHTSCTVSWWEGDRWELGICWGWDGVLDDHELQFPHLIGFYSKVLLNYWLWFIFCNKYEKVYKYFMHLDFLYTLNVSSGTSCTSCFLWGTIYWLYNKGNATSVYLTWENAQHGAEESQCSF